MEQALLQYGYLLLLAGSIVEGDATVIAAAFLAHRGYFSLMTVLVIAILSTTAANEIYFRIARAKGRDVLERKVARSPRYARMQRWINRRAGLLLFLSRFLWGFRVAIPAACGAAGMCATRFFAFNLAGAVLWAAAMVAAGYAFGGALHRLWAGVRHYEWIIAGLILVGGSLLIQRRRRKHPGMIRLLLHPAEIPLRSVEEIGEEILPGHHPVLSHLG